MREINFEHYKIFYYVAKFQNITMAANYLFLSQPSISRCVKNLEDELGCKLFVRSKKGVELTTGGEMLFKHISIACKHIRGQVERTLFFNNFFDILSHTFRIFCKDIRTQSLRRVSVN